MTRTDDTTAFMQAFLDTPIGIPEHRVRKAHQLGDPNHLLDVPGTCLKTRAKDATGMPETFGILTSYDEDRDVVVVRGHATPVSPRCVWTGTVGEYRAMWRVD